MKSRRNSGIFIKMLLASACIFAGATVSHAQTTGTASSPEQIQQQIDQLQKLLELQQQVQQQTGSQPQGGFTQGQPASTPQYAPPASQYQGGFAQPQGGFVQSPQQPTGGVVTLSPVDTGRNAVTFTIGGGNDRASRGDFDTPRFAIKTNLLYAGATLSPNLSFEAGLGERTSIEATVGYNGWTNLWDGASGDDSGPVYDAYNTYKRRLDHIFGKGEFRYWFGERFRGHFVGANVFYADYNVGELKVPLLFDAEAELPDDGTKGIDYDGNAIGGGFTYGYMWRFSRVLAAEFSLGVGVAMMKYDKSFIGEAEAPSTGYKLTRTIPYKKTYFGPTSLGIKLVFTIN